MNFISIQNKLTLILFFMTFTVVLQGQLSQSRLNDLADIKVERFQNILDLTPSQSVQLKKETIKLLLAHGNAANGSNVVAQINKNLDVYYSSLSTLKPQQLATLKLMDSLDRQSRRESYKDLMAEYGQSSDFAVAVAAYNWNISIPILVSYRKDLDRYISPLDQAIIAEMREKMIAKYNFIVSIRENEPSEATESIVSLIQQELLAIIQESELPQLLRKYDDNLASVRAELSKYEGQSKKDIQSIYEDYMVDNYQKQISEESAFLAMLGISKLLKDSFFLLMDGDSRATSFKINAMHLMANSLSVNEQF